MSFEIALTRKAEADLARLPAVLQEHVSNKLLELRTLPSGKRRAVVSPPFPPGGMIYEFAYLVAGHRYQAMVFYRFAQDESTLVVTDIGYTDLEVSP